MDSKHWDSWPWAGVRGVHSLCVIGGLSRMGACTQEGHTACRQGGGGSEVEQQSKVAGETTAPMGCTQSFGEDELQTATKHPTHTPNQTCRVPMMSWPSRPAFAPQGRPWPAYPNTQQQPHSDGRRAPSMQGPVLFKGNE